MTSIERKATHPSVTNFIEHVQYGKSTLEYLLLLKDAQLVNEGLVLENWNIFRVLQTKHDLDNT